MTAPLTIKIGELIVPGTSQADGEAIARSTQRTLSQLYQKDQSAGVTWRETLAAISLDADPRLSTIKLGEVIAYTIRARLVEPEQAR